MKWLLFPNIQTKWRQKTGNKFQFHVSILFQNVFFPSHCRIFIVILWIEICMSFLSVNFVEFELKENEHLRQWGKLFNDFDSPTIIEFRTFSTFPFNLNLNLSCFATITCYSLQINNSTTRSLALLLCISRVSVRFVKDAQYNMYEIIQNNDDLISSLSHRVCLCIHKFYLPFSQWSLLNEFQGYARHTQNSNKKATTTTTSTSEFATLFLLLNRIMLQFAWTLKLIRMNHSAVLWNQKKKHIPNACMCTNVWNIPKVVFP